jgi:hypothetical protein
MTELETAFHQEMLDTYEKSVRAINYRPSAFLKLVNELGGVAAARRLLARDEPSDGFTTLRQHHRLELSVEALVLKPKYASLFTEAERARARQRLAEVKYRPSWDSGPKAVPPTKAAPHPPAQVPVPVPVPPTEAREPLSLSGPLTVRELAEQLDCSPIALIRQLLRAEIMATVDQTLDLATATRLVEDLGFAVTSGESRASVTPPPAAPPTEAPAPPRSAPSG